MRQTTWWCCLVVNMLIIIAMNVIVVPMARSEEGFATWYSVKSAQSEGTSGVRTANVEVYDETAFTAALPSRPWGRNYRVCLEGTNRCVVVRHNDYGPGRTARHRGVVIDLTPA